MASLSHVGHDIVHSSHMLDEKRKGKKDAGYHHNAVENIQVSHGDHASEQGIDDDKYCNDYYSFLCGNFSSGDNIKHPASSSKLVADNCHIGNYRGYGSQNSGPLVVPGFQDVRNSKLAKSSDSACYEKDNNDAQPAAAAADKRRIAVVVAEIRDAKNIS